MLAPALLDASVAISRYETCVGVAQAKPWKSDSRSIWRAFVCVVDLAGAAQPLPSSLSNIIRTRDLSWRMLTVSTNYDGLDSVYGNYKEAAWNVFLVIGLDFEYHWWRWTMGGEDSEFMAVPAHYRSVLGYLEWSSFIWQFLQSARRNQGNWQWMVLMKTAYSDESLCYSDGNKRYKPKQPVLWRRVSCCNQLNQLELRPQCLN